jgi:hypothetical protein
MPEADTMTPSRGYTQGIQVFRDPRARFMPARPLWNQHSYHITNINDDLSAPTMETGSWLSWNSYRENVGSASSIPGSLAPDYTAGPSTAVDQRSADCTLAWTLHASLCNRGAGPIGAGAPGTFYDRDPRDLTATALCTGRTTADLAPGQCGDLQCDWKDPPSPDQAADLWFRSNDDGQHAPLAIECKRGNDLLFLPGATCRTPG